MRDLQKGDLVLIKDSNALRGEWKRGIIKEAVPSLDGHVRKAIVSYKCLSEENSNKKYTGAQYIDVERPVQNLVVLAAVNEE